MSHPPTRGSPVATASVRVTLAGGLSLHVVQSAFQPRADGPDVRPTLVLLHHFGGSARTWEPVLAELRGEFHFIAPDLRGFGDSPVPADGDCSVGAMVGDVVGVIRALGLRRWVLVGHSMGGKVALALAASAPRPAGLEALVLLAPSPPTPEPMPEAERARLLAGHGDADAARTTIVKNVGTTLPEGLYRLAKDDLLRASPVAWRAWLERGSREDLGADIFPPGVPVFLAAGEGDETITADLLRREVAGRVGGAEEVNVLPGARHLLPLEVPRAVADLIRRAAGGP